VIWAPNTISPRLKALTDSMKRRIEIYLEYETDNVQSYMRKNAPWTDRTGAARNGLFAERHDMDIVCFHTVPYGIYLETRWSGKYAIIDPTILHEGRRIMRGMKEIMRRAG
jgi:hypothetical protein